MYPMVVQWAHGPTHRSKTQMNDLIGAYWFAPGISSLTANFTSSCLTCGKCNPGRMEKVHLARPLYPFQRIQIDHIQMPPSGGFKYALVVVDLFSGWPEAFLVRNHSAKTPAKKLLSEMRYADMGTRIHSKSHTRDLVSSRVRLRVPSHSAISIATTVRFVTFQGYRYDIAVSDTQQRSGILLRIVCRSRSFGTYFRRWISRCHR
ncbi:unnamed protein product [Ranitomeya imitator]|uniref:Integrase catalytic domain-containing protein n=1 Tax=Ranitomeya imitator TaxID=111125 RepID=A0ABN9MIM9_9NEOB|nr:unnamed protein product [Ranitomeya imitator]